MKTKCFDHSPRRKEVRFASFISGEFTTMQVINPPERKLAKRTSVHCCKNKGASKSKCSLFYT